MAAEPRWLIRPLRQLRTARRRPRLGLRARLLMLTGAIALPLLGLQLVSAVQERAHAVDQAASRLTQIAGKLASRQNDTLQDLSVLVRLLARAPELRQPGQAACHALLREIDNEHPMVASVLVLDTAGIVRCNSREPVARPLDVSHRPWFRDASAPDAPGIVTSDMQFGIASQEPTVLVVAPILADGARQGYVAIGLRLGWVSDSTLRDSVLPAIDVSILDTGSAHLFTRGAGANVWQPDGTASHDIIAALLARRTASVADATRLHAAAILPAGTRGNTAILLGIDRAPVIARADRLLWRQLAGALALSAFGFAIAWLLTDQVLLRPIGALLHSAERLAQGERATRVRLARMSTPEFRALGLSLNRAAWALEVQERRLQTLVATDPLTGLANRRRFDELLTMEWRRGRRHRMSVAVAMIDVDRFKQYNDTWGHQRGDAVLQAVGRALESVLRRPGDFVARYGGEEFVVVMPGTDQEGARHCAERMRLAVRDLGIPHAVNAGGSVTISIGCAATLPCSGDGATLLVHAADQALYAAKAGGRDCVRCPAETQQTFEALLIG